MQCIKDKTGLCVCKYHPCHKEKFKNDLIIDSAFEIAKQNIEREKVLIFIKKELELVMRVDSTDEALLNECKMIISGINKVL